MEDDSGGTGSAERQRLHEDIELMKSVLQDDIHDEYSEEEDEHIRETGEGDDVESDPAADDNDSLPARDPNSEESNETFLFQTVEGHEVEEDEEEAEDKDTEDQEVMIALDEGELLTTPETCLALNRAYQEVIGQNLARLELALSQNREQQQMIQEEIEEELKAGRSGNKRRTVAAYCVPYFRDANNMCPPTNVDTTVKRENERNPHVRLPRVWTEADSKLLRKAVKEDALQQIIRPLMNWKELEHEKLQQATTEEGKAPIKERLAKLNVKIQLTGRTKDQELYGTPSLDTKVDWMKISAFDFDGAFSESFLKHMWCNLEHPSYEKTSWAAEEDQRLLELAESHENRRWDIIATELATCRSAFQCLRRFQTKLNPCLGTGKWNQEEDTLLNEAVLGLTVNNFVPWHNVGDFMEGRSMEQCKKRWNLINRNIRRGRWTPEEDVKLLAAVHCYGQNWVKIQQFVPNRSFAQCRERWANSLSQEIKYGQWTYEEDRKLVMLYHKYRGGRWAKIAKEMPGRTDNMVLQRHRRLITWKKQNDILASLPEETLEMLHGESDLKEKPDVKHSEKMERLIKQRKAEREWRDKLRQEDLMLVCDSQDNEKEQSPLDDNGNEGLHDSPSQHQRALNEEAGMGEDDGENEEEGEEEGEEEEEGDEGESANNNVKGKHLSKGMLEILAKKVYRERQANWNRERELIDEDIKRGVYVPRPPDSIATRGSGFVGERRSLSKIIFAHVRETLASTSKSTPEKVFRHLKESLKGTSRTLDRTDSSKETTSPIPVARILQAALECRKQQQTRDIKMGRPLQPEQVHDVEVKLAMLLRGRVTRKRSHGRPRKFLVTDGGQQPSNSSRMHGHSKIVRSVNNLMLTALSIDKDGSQLMAQSVTQALKAGNSSQESSSESATSRLTENRETENVTNRMMGEEEAAVASTQGENSEGGKEKTGKEEAVLKLLKKKLPQCHQEGKVLLVDAQQKLIELKPHVSAELPRDISLLHDLLGPVKEPALYPAPRVQKRAYSRKAAKVYNIPPLPPNCLTLNAFRLLLLKRRDLVANARRHHAGERKNKPGGGNTEATEEAPSGGESMETSGAESKKPADGENKMPSGGESKNPSGGSRNPGALCHISKRKPLRSTDIDPDMIKKLSKKFPRWQVLEARRALARREEAQESQKRKEMKIKEDSLSNPAAKVKGTIMKSVKNSHDYQMLRARFQSLFLWPALLSTVDVRDTNSKMSTNVKGNGTATATEEVAAEEPIEEDNRSEASMGVDITREDPQPSTSGEVNSDSQNTPATPQTLKRPRRKPKKKYALSKSSRSRKMHVMNKEAKEVFRRKCVDSYQTRVLKKTQATETNGEDEAPPAKRCKEDAPESKEVRRVSTRAMLLQDKKRQKEEEQEMREEKLRKDGERTAVVRLKRLQQAALKHSSPRIDKSLLAAGREVRMESHANSTEQLKPASPEPPDQSIE